MIKVRAVAIVNDYGTYETDTDMSIREVYRYLITNNNHRLELEIEPNEVRIFDSVSIKTMYSEELMASTKEPIRNIDILSRAVAPNGNIIGCYDNRLESLSSNQIKRLIKLIDDFGDSQDIDLYINKKAHVLTVNYVDAEVDLILQTRAEYIEQFGNERYCR